MDYSKLNRQSSTFSLTEEPTNSQILASSPSLSIVSELPDLKNWFPSYQYETPLLSSNSLLDDSVVHEGEREEKEKNSDGFSRNGKKDEFFVHEKQNPNWAMKCGSFSGSKILDFLESTSLISEEPTDIRNWCSSYVYESPSLETTDSFGDSVPKESKNGKDGFGLENRNTEKGKEFVDFSINRSDSEEIVCERVQAEGLAKCKNNPWRDHEQERQLVSETPGPSESPSLLSEPTDIRNWCSSYVYESPSLDATKSFGASILDENKSGKDGFLIESRNGEKEEDLEGFSKKRSIGEEVVDSQPEGLAKCIVSGRDNKQDSLPGRPRGLVSENLPTHIGMHKSLQNHVMTPAQDVEISIVNKESCECKGTKMKPLNNERSSCSKVKKSTQDMAHSKHCNLQENSEAKLHGSKGRKDDVKERSEDGFVTTRKGKLGSSSYENMVESGAPRESSKVRAPLAGDAGMKRKALADATNFDHSRPVVEIMGKWKCPQRSKPNVGASLKQLRLEKWVRKL